MSKEPKKPTNSKKEKPLKLTGQPEKLFKASMLKPKNKAN